MIHSVLDFEMEDNYSSPPSSGVHHRPKKPSLVGDEGIVELLWQNGQVVMQSQNHRPYSSLKKSPLPPPPPPKSSESAVIPAEASIPPQEESAASHLLMPEDDMASWLNYHLDSPSFDRDLCTDFLYPTTLPAHSPDHHHRNPPPPPPPPPPKPPIPPGRPSELHGSGTSDPSRWRESTVVDSSETPPRGSESRVSITAAAGSGPRGGSSGVCGERGNAATAEVTVTSSSGGSGATSSGQQTENPPPPAVAAARRRRARGPVEEEEFHIEDVEFESADAKTEVRGSTSAKRSRAAEVHNLSERRRRDRINEKMKALQELIPHCNKSDKASMLDEAIEYLKSLQMQVQMMSMGCSMFPMVFPNVQHYMSPMGMGMNLPVMPFPSVFTGSTLALPAAATHSGPKLPIRGFHMQPIPAPDPSTVQAINQTGPTLNPVGAQNPTQHQTPNFVDPYQHFVGLHQVQLPESKNKPVARSSTSEPNAGSGAENLDKPKIG